MLVIATGLAEGTALVLLLMSLVGDAPAWLSPTLLILSVLRTNAWFSYRGDLRNAKAPKPARDILDGISSVFVIAGNVLPAVLAILGLLVNAAGPLLEVLAGIAAVLAGT